jgi:site-specific recombinase XerD
MNDYLSEYKKDLVLRGYSERTKIAYTTLLSRYLNHYNGKLEQDACKQIKDYLHYLIQVKKVSRPLMNQCYSALKFFYTTTLKANWEGLKIPYVKHTKKLPEILSRAEIESCLASTSNIKHKAMLMVVYSAGLRVSEAAALKLQ